LKEYLEEKIGNPRLFFIKVIKGAFQKRGHFLSPYVAKKIMLPIIY
jgi:hypothetical protein